MTHVAKWIEVDQSGSKWIHQNCAVVQFTAKVGHRLFLGFLGFLLMFSGLREKLKGRISKNNKETAKKMICVSRVAKLQ